MVKAELKMKLSCSAYIFSDEIENVETDVANVVSSSMFYLLLFLLASPYPSAAVVDSSAPTLELDPRLLLALDSAACSQSVAEWLDSVSILQAESPQ
jgi:hypothetical protein